MGSGSIDISLDRTSCSGCFCGRRRWRVCPARDPVQQQPRGNFPCRGGLSVPCGEDGDRRLKEYRKRVLTCRVRPHSIPLICHRGQSLHSPLGNPFHRTQYVSVVYSPSLRSSLRLRDIEFDERIADGLSPFGSEKITERTMRYLPMYFSAGSCSTTGGRYRRTFGRCLRGAGTGKRSIC